MKQQLIIPLMGKRRKNIFSNNKILFNGKYDYLLNHILTNFEICSKIIIICKKKEKKYLRIKKSKKIKFIYLKNSLNQIDTILKCKSYICTNNPTLILNPDSLFKINLNDQILKKQFKKNEIIFFGIKDYVNLLNEDRKDTFETRNNKILSIRIKGGIANNKQKFVSAGLYYFKSLEILFNLISEFLNKSNINNKLQLGHIIKYSLFKKNVIEPSFIQNFIDFGDNKKCEEYFFWLKFFKKNFFHFDKIKNENIFNIIPAAGEGNRHKKLGYRKPKPLIPISNETMFEHSLRRLPNKTENLFIFKRKSFKNFKINKIFNKNKNLNNFYLIDKKTKGMAETILLAKKKIPLDRSVIVSSCDISFIINYKKLYNLLKKKPDGIIFTWRNYPFADESPNSHAYVKVRDNIVTKISEKKTVSKNPNNDFAVTGIFYFKNSKLLLDCIKHMMSNRITVNNEYYVATSMDKMLRDKLKIYNFEVDQFISWSLPEHLKRYNYWEKIFK